MGGNGAVEAAVEAAGAMGAAGAGEAAGAMGGTGAGEAAGAMGGTGAGEAAGAMGGTGVVEASGAMGLTGGSSDGSCESWIKFKISRKPRMPNTVFNTISRKSTRLGFSILRYEQ